MKNVLKYKIIYIVGALLSVLSIGGSFLLYGVSIWNNYVPFPYYISLLIFMFLYALGAYLGGDFIIFRYRNSTDEYDPVTPLEVQIKAWKIRAPFVIALIVTSLVTLVLFIISLCMGGKWPLL